MNKDYSKIIKKNALKPNYLRNSFVAFVVGGMIGVIGQGLSDFYIYVFKMTKDNANSLMIVTLILLSSLTTGLGIYDYFGQFSGAGAFVPITGFANSMTSAALEGKSEGITLGIAANMFKLAGSVIVFGVVAAYILGAIRYLFLS
ncbi:MAG TPA: stage V sporulation protein AC [Haloplasmataceae bacterium]